MQSVHHVFSSMRTVLDTPEETSDPQRQPGALKGGFSGLLQDLNALRADRKLADVILVCGPSQDPLPVHSALLVARCPLIASAVREFVLAHPSNLDGSTGSPRALLRLPFPEISRVSMEKVTSYIYTGRICIGEDDVVKLFQASVALGMSGLGGFCVKYIRSTLDAHSALTFLREGLQLELPQVLDVALSFIAENTLAVLRLKAFVRLPRACVLEISKLEDIQATEDQLWYALVKWACHQASIDHHGLILTKDVRSVLAPLLRDFLRPGHVRILSFGSGAFSLNVEHFDILENEELLLKYRYDATFSATRFEDAFPYERVEFLSRIRQRSHVYESKTHPHPRGISEFREIIVPLWAQRLIITFDPRTSLGKYADLSFYEDADFSKKLASVDTIFKNHRLEQRQGNNNGNRHPTVIVTCQGDIAIHRKVHFTFYAPDSFPAGWGYRFRVRPMLV